MIRIEGFDPRAQQNRLIARARNLRTAAARLDRDGEFWTRHGWSEITLRHTDGRAVSKEDAADRRLWNKIRWNV